VQGSKGARPRLGWAVMCPPLPCLQRHPWGHRGSGQRPLERGKAGCSPGCWCCCYCEPRGQGAGRGAAAAEAGAGGGGTHPGVSRCAGGIVQGEQKAWGSLMIPPPPPSHHTHQEGHAPGRPVTLTAARASNLQPAPLGRAPCYLRTRKGWRPFASDLGRTVDSMAEVWHPG